MPLLAPPALLVDLCTGPGCRIRLTRSGRTQGSGGLLVPQPGGAGAVPGAEDDVAGLDRAVERTSHRPLLPSFARLGKFISRWARPLLLIGILLPFCYIAQGANDFR